MKYKIIVTLTGNLKDLSPAVNSFLTTNPTFEAAGKPFFISFITGWAQAVCTIGDRRINKTTDVPVGNYNINFAEDYILSKSAITPGGDYINLPPLAWCETGQEFIVSDESGTCEDGIKPIYFKGFGAELIDGQNIIEIAVPYGVARVYKNNAGTQWKSI